MLNYEMPFKSYLEILLSLTRFLVRGKFSPSMRAHVFPATLRTQKVDQLKIAGLQDK